MTGVTREHAANRLVGIDAGRFLAIIGVVLIHTADKTHFPQAGGGEWPDTFGIDAGGLIDQASRFAVPFFFCASGFFIADQSRRPNWDSYRRILSRLAPIFVFWSTFYVLASPDRAVWLSRPSFMLRWALVGGPGFHLWFIPSLAICLAMAIWLRNVRRDRLLALALVLFATGVFLGAYLPAFVDRPDPVFRSIARDGPTFGFIFVVIGMWFGERRELRPSTSFAFVLLTVGLVAQLGEATLLDYLRISPFYRSDFLFGTLPYGVGAFLLAWSVDGKSTVARNAARLGRHSLGMYACHIAFVWGLAALIPPLDVGQRLLIALIALVGSLALTSVLSGQRWSGWIVGADAGSGGLSVNRRALAQSVAATMPQEKRYPWSPPA